MIFGNDYNINTYLKSAWWCQFKCLIIISFCFYLGYKLTCFTGGPLFFSLMFYIYLIFKQHPITLLILILATTNSAIVRFSRIKWGTSLFHITIFCFFRYLWLWFKLIVMWSLLILEAAPYQQWVKWENGSQGFKVNYCTMWLSIFITICLLMSQVPLD